MVDYYPLKRLAGTQKEYDASAATVCQECTVGCALTAYMKEGAIVDIQGGESHPVNRGRLCARGIAFLQGLDHPDRITQIAHRQDVHEPFQTLGNWEKAMDSLAEQLRKVRGRYGPKSLMIGCDPDAGLDFYLGALRFAGLWGTPHVYHPLYSPNGLPVRSDHIGAVPPCHEWSESRCIFLIEADLAATHPVAFGRLLDARQKGTKIIAVDSRFTATMSKADVALHIKPETGNKLGLALMKVMVEEGLCDPDAVEKALAEPAQWKSSLEAMSLEGIEELTGLSLDRIKELARLLASAKPATIVTGKRLANRPNHPVWLTMALAAGWSGKAGGGWYPLDAGLPPVDLTGDLDPKGSRKGSAEEGESEAPAMDESAEMGEDPDRPVKALICSGNCLHDFMSPLRGLAGSTDLNIYFGAFPNETWKLSHAVIPAMLWPEKENLGFTSDRAIQVGGRITEPPTGCRSGLEFWTDLAQRFGDAKRLEWKAFFPWKQEDGSIDHHGFHQWVLDRSPLTAGVKLEDLSAGKTDLQFWPVAAASKPSGKGSKKPAKTRPFLAPSSMASPSQSSDTESYPLIFQTTRVVTKSGDASQWWPWTKDLEDGRTVQIHPETARALGIENGEDVLVSGPAGVMECRAHLSRMVPVWMIWSQRKLGGNRALVQKQGQAADEAARILRELLQ